MEKKINSQFKLIFPSKTYINTHVRSKGIRSSIAYVSPFLWAYMIYRQGYIISTQKSRLIGY